MEQQEITRTVNAFLASHRKAVLAVVDPEGRPSTSLMLYAVNENLVLHFGTCRSFGKYKSLLQNPNVSLTVQQEAVDPKQAVEIRGTAEFLQLCDTPACLEWFTKQNPSDFYVKDREDFVMFKVIPHSVRWMDGTSGTLVMEHLEMDHA